MVQARDGLFVQNSLQISDEGLLRVSWNEFLWYHTMLATIRDAGHEVLIVLLLLFLVLIGRQVYSALV